MAKKRRTIRQNMGDIELNYTADSSDSTRGSDYNPFKNIADEMGNILKGRKRDFKSGKFAFFTILGSYIDLGEAERRFSAGKFKTVGNFNLKPGVTEDVQFFVQALDELTRILQNKIIHTRIVRKAYDSTIRPVLEKRIGEPTLSRGGSGRQFSAEYKGRSGEDLGRKWKQIYKKIIAPIKLQSTSGNSMQFYAFTLEELLAINITSKRSKFTSVFMMAEFGTGNFADTPGPRLYKSSRSTPFKVSPQLGSIIARYGGDSSTSQWFSRPSKAFLISDLHFDLQEKLKQLRSRKIPESDRRKSTFGTLRDMTDKEVDVWRKRINRNINFIEYLVAAHIYGSRGPKSIQPRHILFSSRGIVLDIQRAYKKFLLEYARLLNEAIRNKLGNLWSPNGFRINFPDPILPFNFDVVKQQMQS